MHLLYCDKARQYLVQGQHRSLNYVCQVFHHDIATVRHATRHVPMWRAVVDIAIQRSRTRIVHYYPGVNIELDPLI